jgi:hypothetical protein
VLYRQFDFWAGLWEVTGAKGRFLGINRVVAVDGGCALQETWSSGGGHFTGRSLNRVGSDGRWHQTWVDSGGQPLELSGGLSGSSMVLEGETPGPEPKAPATRQRITWTPEADGTVRQLWESSSDGGKSYSVAFDGRYRRIVPSAAPRGGFLERTGGEWIGSGAILDTPANVELSIRPIVGGKFFELQWLNLGSATTGAFEGRAVYRDLGDGRYSAHWVDSLGNEHAIQATAEGESLVALWGERGKTVYRLLESRDLEVVDSVKSSAGTWREFGRTVLKRKSAAPAR